MFNHKFIGRCAHIDDGKIYFTLRNANIIGRLDIASGFVSYLSGPAEETSTLFDLYGGIYVLNRRIILCPYNARRIWIYDLDNKEWISCEVEENNIKESAPLFDAIFCYQNKIYMFGGYSYNVYLFDPNILKGNYILEKNNDLCGGSYVVDNGKLYAGVAHTNNVLILDLNTYAQDYMRIYEINSLAGVQMKNNILYVVSRYGDILIAADKRGNVIDKVKCPYGAIVNGFAINGHSLLIHGESEAMLFHLYKKFFQKMNYKVSFVKCYLTNEYIIATGNGDIMYGDTKMKKIYKIKMDSEILSVYSNQCTHIKPWKYLTYEDDLLNLQLFLETL